MKAAIIIGVYSIFEFQRVILSLVLSPEASIMKYFKEFSYYNIAEVFGEIHQKGINAKLKEWKAQMRHLIDSVNIHF